MSSVESWSTTAANNNASPPDGFPEGQSPSSLNNSARELMAALAVWFRQLPWIRFSTGQTLVRNSATEFQLSSVDLTSLYTVGRRIREVGATTVYGYIATSQFTGGHTVVTVTNDAAAAIPTSLTAVDVAVDNTNTIGTAALATIGTSAAHLPSNTQVFDTQRDYTRQHRFVRATLTDAATITWNLDTQAIAKVTLGGNRTLQNPTNMRDGGSYELYVFQDGTGGRTLSFDTAYIGESGILPTIGTGANDLTILSFSTNGTNMFVSFSGPYPL